MPPEQTSQQNQNDPYGFITNPDQPSKRKLSFNFNFGNTPQQRAIIVGIGFVLLIIIFMLVLSFFNKASNAQKDRLVAIAQTQAEIARVAGLADQSTTDTTTHVLAVNIQLTLLSDLQETSQLLAKRGTKLNISALDKFKNEATDKELEQAAANDQFDEAFSSLMSDKLDKYRTLLNPAFKGGSQLEKQIIQQDYDDAALLKPSG